MPIVNTTIPITAERCDEMIRMLVSAYPFCRTEALTSTAFQRPVRTLSSEPAPAKSFTPRPTTPTSGLPLWCF